MQNINELKNYVLQASDGAIGRCRDFLFDDRHWTIRYMVADTRKWLPGRKVLVSPEWAGGVDWQDRKVYVDLSRGKIKDSPEYKPAEPPEREYEDALFGHYGLPPYWRRP